MSQPRKFTVIDERGEIVAKQIVFTDEMLEALGVKQKKGVIPEDEQELFKYHVLEQIHIHGMKLILFNEYMLGDLGKITSYTILRLKYGSDYINFIFSNEGQLRKLRNAIDRALYYIRKVNKSNWETTDFQKRIEVYKSLPGETMRSINQKQFSGNLELKNQAGTCRKRENKAAP